jgi:hypothetical protein
VVLKVGFASITEIYSGAERHKLGSKSASLQLCGSRPPSDGRERSAERRLTTEGSERRRQPGSGEEKVARLGFRGFLGLTPGKNIFGPVKPVPVSLVGPVAYPIQLYRVEKPSGDTSIRP